VSIFRAPASWSHRPSAIPALAWHEDRSRRSARDGCHDAAAVRRDISRSSQEGDPLILFNAWDVATGEAIAKTFPAVATSSAAVASALGYADGEDVPLNMVIGLVARMTAAVSVPVSIDLEAGYGDTPEAAAGSVTEVLKAGAIGINIEDGLSGGKRQLVGLEQHAAKIKAVRDAAQKLGIRLFINARTDPFLLKFGSPDECLNEAVKRAKAYADAGADGIFVPGLTDPCSSRSSLYSRLCRSTSW